MSKAKLIFADQTVREIVHISIGGSQIRIRLSNAYGKEPLEIGAVHVAVHAEGSGIALNSDHVAVFSGRARVTIPPDALALSDPIALPVAPLSDLVISIYLPNHVVGSGIHYAAQQTTYVASGDVTGAMDLPAATTLTSWVFLTGVDVLEPKASALVAFGDSITDGYASTNDANHRWPNYLAARLLSASKPELVAVLDEGIGGNRILHDPNTNIAFGVNGLARFDRDVLAQPGVKYVIVLEGINDLGHAGPDTFPAEQVSAEDIIAGLKQLISRAHEKGLKVYGGTLTPFAGTAFGGYFSEDKEGKRKAVNEWIRTSHSFDAVIDFDKTVQDPARPDHIAAPFDSGDHLHPNDAGYKGMADSIDLNLF